MEKKNFLLNVRQSLFREPAKLKAIALFYLLQIE